MRAVAYKTPQPISAETSLIDVELPMPEAKGQDLLVEIKAISVNPVDVKVRAHSAPPADELKVLGWDAAGIVKAVGAEVTLFRPGDEVFYSGVISRPGSNAEFHLVDERIVGAKPKNLDFAAAAALPLTSITAYEALFDRLKVQDAVSGAARSILIVGGAGGVGSIAIQIARALTDLTVIATASRPETQDWVKGLGAHHVVDHSKPIAPQVAALGIGAGIHLLDHQYRQPYRRHRRSDCAAGPLRADRRPEDARHRALQAQSHLRSLGTDVHPPALRHA